MLFVKKTQLLILASVENRCLHFELLFSKHTKYLLNIIQHMIQSRRLKVILTILGIVYNNTKVQIHINLCIDQVNYNNKSYVHTATNDRTTNSKSTNQGVKIAANQCHNIQQESILSNTVTESDIYNNYSYTSYINWDIGKTPEIYSKKLEFKITNLFWYGREGVWTWSESVRLVNFADANAQRATEPKLKTILIDRSSWRLRWYEHTSWHQCCMFDG